MWAASVTNHTVHGGLCPLAGASNAVRRLRAFSTSAARQAAPVRDTPCVIYFFIEVSDSLTATCQMIKPNAILFNTSAAL